MRAFTAAKAQDACKPEDSSGPAPRAQQTTGCDNLAGVAKPPEQESAAFDGERLLVANADASEGRTIVPGQCAWACESRKMTLRSLDATVPPRYLQTSVLSSWWQAQQC
jgi:hypothetical protein